MKKSVRAVIAFFLVIFSLAGIITASASTPNGAIADLEAEGTTMSASSVYYETTTGNYTPSSTDYYDPSTTYPIATGTDSDAPETTTAVYSEELINLPVGVILDIIVELAKNESAQWYEIEEAVIRVVDIVENIGYGTVSEGELDEAIADLEAVLEDEDIEGMDELLDLLKKKIKGMYAGEKATTAPSTTYPIATGTDSDAPTTIKPTRVDTDIPATGGGDDCTTIWDIIGDLFEKIEGFFRSILEILC